MQARRQTAGAAERGAAATYRGAALARAARGDVGDINVTPLVDVVLVLLLVFMVTAPMMSRGIDVSLPGGEPAEDRRRRTASPCRVNAEGRIYIGDQPGHPPPARGPAPRR